MRESGLFFQINTFNILCIRIKFHIDNTSFTGYFTMQEVNSHEDILYLYQHTKT